MVIKMVSYKINKNNQELKQNDSSFNINKLFYRDLFNHICKLEKEESNTLSQWMNRDKKIISSTLVY